MISVWPIGSNGSIGWQAAGGGGGGGLTSVCRINNRDALLNKNMSENLFLYPVDIFNGLSPRSQRNPIMQVELRLQEILRQRPAHLGGAQARLRCGLRPAVRSAGRRRAPYQAGASPRSFAIPLRESTLTPGYRAVLVGQRKDWEAQENQAQDRS